MRIKLAECDEVSVQDDSGSLRPAWPKEYARQAEIGLQMRVTPAVHTPTGAVVFLPPRVTLNGSLKMVRGDSRTGE